MRGNRLPRDTIRKMSVNLLYMEKERSFQGFPVLLWLTKCSLSSARLNTGLTGSPARRMEVSVR